MFKITKMTFATKDRSRALARVYVHPAKESLIENLEQRRNRPIALFRRYAEAAIESTPLAGSKLKWSQVAGCSCGCSPAFVVQGWTAKNYPSDLFVTIGLVAQPAATEPR